MKSTVKNTDPAKLLKTFKRRIAKEGWINSILCGLLVGLGAETICSLAFWAFGIKLFWISIIVFAAVTGISVPLFYFCKFKRSTKYVASRVDMLGLEERILTMTQFADDDSFMARYQREDAMRSLEKVNSSLLKIVVSVPLIVVCSIALVAGIGTTTASAVSDKSLIDLINTANQPPVVYCTVKYGVKDDIGGKVFGRCDQLVESGTSADAVQAVADENYIFIGWTDGCEDAYRTDAEIDKDLKAYAVFVPIEENDEEDEDMSDNESGSGSGDQGPQDSPIGDQNDKGPDGGDSDGDGASGGATNPSNQVIDGATFIGDVYGNSLSGAADAAGNAGLDGNQSGMIGDYFGNIAK